MTLRTIHRLAIFVLAFYAFGQAGVALAACGMERGAMAQAMATTGDQACGDCAEPSVDTVTAACVAHCTADLQLTAAALDLVPSPAISAMPVLVLPRYRSPPVIAYLPPGPLPRRILLHSFQV